MKKLLMVSAILVTAALSFSCSSPAYIEKDNSVNLADYKTYMWVETRSSENDDSKRATAYADISVHNAVNSELAGWGWKEVTENPDVYLSYDIFVERTVTTQQQPVYSRSYTRYYYNPVRRRWSPIYYPSQFLGYDTYQTPVREGTITITMVDADTDKKIWQGWTTETLNTSGITDLDAQKSIRNIFKQA